MNHYPRTPEEQEQLDKKMQELDQKMLEETERYYARLDLKYGIAFALSIIALLINLLRMYQWQQAVSIPTNPELGWHAFPYL